ncbi:PREDICTED: DEP domain-containing protein 1A-like, partial [Amphimedon queenslandica]
ATTLLQKFLECEVIEDAKGKERDKFNDGSSLYHFVTRPGPLNFLGFTPTKRKRQEIEEEQKEGSTSSVCLTNPYAAAAGEDIGGEEGEVETERESVSSILSVNSTSPVLKSGPLTVTEDEKHKIWQDMTLTRLLTILPSLGTLPVVDGGIIASNCDKEKRGGGPTGSAEDVTGGLPIYHGFEQDVFQAISNYFTQQLQQPLIPQALYELILTSIHPLIARKDSTATDALQLISLMIEPSLRLKLHRLL